MIAITTEVTDSTVAVWELSGKLGENGRGRNMRVLDYFKRVSSMTAEEVREFLKDKSPGEYNLIDVRQPLEYERGHIPGAQLIPLGELRDHASGIDPSKPTITY